MVGRGGGGEGGIVCFPRSYHILERVKGVENEEEGVKKDEK